MVGLASILAAAVLVLVLLICGVIVGLVNAILTAPLPFYSDAVQQLLDIDGTVSSDDSVNLWMHYAVAVIGYVTPFIVLFSGWILVTPDGDPTLAVSALLFVAYHAALLAAMFWYLPSYGIDWNDGDYSAKMVALWCGIYLLHALLLIVTGFLVLVVVMGSLAGLG